MFSGASCPQMETYVPNHFWSLWQVIEQKDNLAWHLHIVFCVIVFILSYYYRHCQLSSSSWSLTNIHIAITSQVIDNEANLATLLTQPVSHCPPQSGIIDHPSCQTRSVFPFCPRPSAICLLSSEWFWWCSRRRMNCVYLLLRKCGQSKAMCGHWSMSLMYATLLITLHSQTQTEGHEW